MLIKTGCPNLLHGCDFLCFNLINECENFCSQFSIPLFAFVNNSFILNWNSLLLLLHFLCHYHCLSSSSHGIQFVLLQQMPCEECFWNKPICLSDTKILVFVAIIVEILFRNSTKLDRRQSCRRWQWRWGRKRATNYLFDVTWAEVRDTDFSTHDLYYFCQPEGNH